MNTEFEVAFTNINHKEIKEVIKNLWWKCIQEKVLMKRVIFKHIDKGLRNSYFRVRNEWNRVTCTYKKIIHWPLDIHSVKEVETEVQDFDAMVEILHLTWLERIASQESYRETWKIWEGISFMLDEWPWLRPFIEIEWSSEEIVRSYTKKLWLNYKDWIFGWVDQIYFQEIWIPHEVVNNLPEISFDNPPKWY